MNNQVNKIIETTEKFINGVDSDRGKISIELSSLLEVELKGKFIAKELIAIATNMQLCEELLK